MTYLPSMIKSGETEKELSSMTKEELEKFILQATIRCYAAIGYKEKTA